MTANGSALWVVKLGGSLLEWDRLWDVFARWRASLPAVEMIVVVGGGELADTIRRLDARYQLGEATAHWLCIDAMRINSQVAARKLACAPVEEHPRRTHQARIAVLDPSAWLRQQEPGAAPAPPLPHGWHVTSDSIAARLARVLVAERLVLLKSAESPGESPPDWAATGYVDRYFPEACRGLTVEAVNLRRFDTAADRAGG